MTEYNDNIFPIWTLTRCEQPIHTGKWRLTFANVTENERFIFPVAARYLIVSNIYFSFLIRKLYGR
jgi:hypothetical protein